MLKRCTVALFVLISAGLAAQADEPRVLGVGAEETLPLTGRLPAIAVDTQDQPHIVADGGVGAYFFHRIGAAAPWVAGSVNIGSLGYRQYYNPHVEIDAANRMWVSGVLVSGIGVFVRENVSTSPTGPFFSDQRIQGAWDIGNLSIDPARPGEMVAMSSNGRWRSFAYNAGAASRLSSLSSGTMSAGGDGEKKSFWISKGEATAHPGQGTYGIWHLAIGGYPPSQPSAYQNSFRQAQGLPPVGWASPGTYPTMGDDGTYVDCVADNMDSRIAYMICDFSTGGRYGGTVGVAMNIWNGNTGQMLRNTGNLLVIDGQGTSGLRRYAPQLAPALDGGCWACWTSGGRIKVQYVGPDGVLGSSVIDVGAGTWGDICTDSEGDVHVAWNRDGQIRYCKIDVAGGTTPSTLAADFDGDGADDVATFSDGTWRIRYSSNIKTMGQAASTPGYFKNFGTVGDLPVPANYDGDTNNVSEIAVYRPSSSTWYILHTNGSVQITPYGSSGDTPVPGDYDGDGTNSPAVCGVNDANELVWVSEDGALDHVVWGLSGDLLVPGDYDGDGKTDVAVVHDDNGNWRWYIRNSGSADINVLYGLAAQDTPVPSDYDADGKTDIGVFRAGSGAWYYHGSTSGAQVFYWGSAEDVPVPADYDGDGTNDIAVFRSDNDGWYIRSSLAGGSLIEAAPVYMGSVSDTPKVGDYDGDSKDDMCTFNRADGTWQMYLSAATGIDRIEPDVFRFGSADDQAVPADYDGDGIIDIGVFRESTGKWYVYASSGYLLQTHFGAPGDSPYPADYDGDGQADWCIVRRNAGMLDWYRYGSSNGYMGMVTAGWDTDEPIPDDYDGDGKADIAVYREGDPSEWHLLQSSNGYEGFVFGRIGDVPLHGQWDSDNIADIGVYRPSTGLWYLWSSVSGLISQAWGAAGDSPVPGDYDGDGDVDISVYRRADRSVWYINQSTNPGELLIRGPVRWQFTGSDIPLGARYGQ